MIEVTFYPGQLYQWKHYNFKNYVIWVAGYQSNKFINDIAKFIKDKKVIDKKNCKKIISFLGDNKVLQGCRSCFYKDENELYKKKENGCTTCFHFTNRHARINGCTLPTILGF